MYKINCDRCHKTFKYNYLLQRHKKKKKLCPLIEIDAISKETDRIKSTANKLEKQVELLVHLQNENTDDEEYYVHQCTFCYKSFKTKKSMTRHINKGRCKLVHDNISIYERELNIDPPDIQSLTCRFCKTNYGKSSSYSRHLKNGCKAKKIYEAQLEKRVLIARNKAASVIQNQTINNTTNNTININMPPMRAFGDENTDYITVKLLINE